MNPWIVVDANITLAQVLPLSYSEAAARYMDEWRRAAVRIAVPTLWEYEVVSTLRKAVARNLLTQVQAYSAIETILQMDFEQVYPTLELDRSALVWAERLGQLNAYDGQYLAVAETLNAEFWTADRRLANGLNQMGETWVHWVGNSK